MAHVITREQNSTAHPVSFMTQWSKWIAYVTADEDLVIISMVTYRTLVPARMSVLFQEESE